MIGHKLGNFVLEILDLPFVVILGDLKGGPILVEENVRSLAQQLLKRRLNVALGTQEGLHFNAGDDVR